MTRAAIIYVLLASGSLLVRGQAPAADPAVPASAPTAQAPVTTTASADVERFQKIEDSWSNAINMRDQYGLELVLSPLFVDISASGDVSTRNQLVAGVLTLDDKTLRLDQKVVTVRMLGDVAVANGTYVLHHKAGNAQADDKGVFTHVFERVRGGWVCVNSQRTMVQVASNAKVKAKRAPSNGELPFHIPIFSKNN